LLGRAVVGVEHCKHLFFHEAALLSLLGQDAFCLAPGTLTFTLSLSFEFFVRGKGRGSGTAYAADEGAHALGKTGRELGNGWIRGLRTLTPCDIGVIVVVVVIIIIRSVLAFNLTGVRVSLETRTKW
jgi:hypothetical protein